MVHINLAVGASAVLSLDEESSSSCQEVLRNQVSKVFWTSDLHDGTRVDTPSVLANLGQTVFVAGQKRRQSPYPEVLNTTGVKVVTNLSPVLLKYTSHEQVLTEQDVVDNMEHYAESAAMRRVDAFVCSFPASMCELWAPFNRSIAFLPAHRYNIGRCSPGMWRHLTDLAVRLAADPRHLVGAMSRYDLEYLRYYTGIADARLVPSFSGFYTRGVGRRYNPAREEVLLFRMNKPEFPERFLSLKNVPRVTWVRDLYPRYALEDLVRHPAIVLLPYSVMSYTLTELYSLSVPLFVPSVRFLRDHGGLGKDRTSTSEPYCPARLRLNDLVRKHVDSPHPYSPNAEFADDAEAEMYWLQFADFYEWPHITHFDSAQDLVRKLEGADLMDIHRRMLEENKIRKRQVQEEWCHFIRRM